MSPSHILDARQAAADLLARAGYRDDAAMVLRGDGDDTREVRLALTLQRSAYAEVERLRQALENYAEAAFWEADPYEASLAFHDRGSAARAALAGISQFQQHRD